MNRSDDALLLPGTTRMVALLDAGGRSGTLAEPDAHSARRLQPSEAIELVYRTRCARGSVARIRLFIYGSGDEFSGALQSSEFACAGW